MLVIGDVHGYYDLLVELISNIQDDDIYFVGDLIDRGKDSLKTLKFVMESNYKLVMGNHEKLMLDYLLSKDEFIKRWWFAAGGKAAYKEFFYETSIEEQDKIRKYLEGLPYYFYVQHKDILISHAGIKGTRGVFEYRINENNELIKVDERKALKSLLEMQTPNDFLWTRDMFIENSVLREFNTVFIAGHTPTPTIDGYEDKPQIVRIDNKFLIDCGVYHYGVLGALQLLDNEVIAHYCSVEKGYYSQSLGSLR